MAHLYERFSLSGGGLSDGVSGSAVSTGSQMWEFLTVPAVWKPEPGPRQRSNLPTSSDDGGGVGKAQARLPSSVLRLGALACAHRAIPGLVMPAESLEGVT